MYPFSGNTPIWLGIKHRIYSNKNWIVTGEGLLSPASGNSAFGSPHIEGTINGIINHQISKQLSWELQLGISELSDPAIIGGQLYRSFNPDFVLNYTFKQKINIYLESFAQTKTSSAESFGLVQGIGLIYLLNKKITVDLAFYQRVTGELLGFERYIGVGFARLF